MGYCFFFWLYAFLNCRIKTGLRFFEPKKQNIRRSQSNHTENIKSNQIETARINFYVNFVKPILVIICRELSIQFFLPNGINHNIVQPSMAQFQSCKNKTKERKLKPEQYCCNPGPVINSHHESVEVFFLVASEITLSFEVIIQQILNPDESEFNQRVLLALFGCCLLYQMRLSLIQNMNLLCKCYPLLDLFRYHQLLILTDKYCQNFHL